MPSPGLTVRRPRGSKGFAASMEMQLPRGVGMLLGRGWAAPPWDLLWSEARRTKLMFVLVKDHLGQHIPNRASTEFIHVWQHSTQGPVSPTPSGL